MDNLSIRYNRVVPIALLVVGILLLLLSLASGAWVSVAAGAVIALLGGLMLKNPMMRIQDGEAQVCNPLGMVIKRHPVSSPQDLALEGNTLRHVPTKKKIASLGFGAHKEDVATLKARLGATA